MQQHKIKVTRFDYKHDKGSWKMHHKIIKGEMETPNPIKI